MSKNLLILFFITILASLARLLYIDHLPPSLTWDEAAWGYNAYSLLTTTSDEFGHFLPITYLESFGDYKPPMYAYLTIPFVALFDITELATRLPSAIAGILTVLVTYFLTLHIFPKKEKLALLSSTILALSPWHILLSRAAFEANVATFFIVTGVWLFLKSTKTNKWFLVLSIISFTASMYTFNSARIVSPLLLIILSFSHKKILIKNLSSTLTSVLIGGLLFLPLLMFLLTPQAGLRFQEVNIFSDSSIVERANAEIASSKTPLITNITNNRRVLFAMDYAQNFLDHLTPNFLFVKGDGNPKFSIQDVGQMYVYLLPFFVFGGFALFRYREGKWWLIPIWIFLSIIPAATARETPHALRIESSLPTFQIISAYGIYKSVSLLKSHKTIVISLITLVAVVNILYFTNSYLRHYSREYSGEWQYGYREMYNYLAEVEKDYEKIYFTKELGRPYIYYLFYRKIPSKNFQKESDINREALGFVNVDRVGKYHFQKTLPTESNKSTLYINTPNSVPDSANILKTVNLLNGKPSLVAYTL